MAEQPLYSNQAQIFSLLGEVRFVPNGIASRTLFRTDGARQVLFGFAQGQELTEHVSAHHVLAQILSGSCEFILKGESHTMRAGDQLYMPPGLAHAVRAKEAFCLLLTLVAATPKDLNPQPGIQKI